MKFNTLVLCGPSGSGKSTLIKRMSGEGCEGKFAFCVSHTTRKARDGEQNGTHYFFIDKSEMEKMILNNEFIEYATFSGNVYGTSWMSIRNVIDQDKVCILDIDVQGVKAVKKYLSESKEDMKMNPLYIFVMPPSMQVLEERLGKRGTENEETLKRRLQAASHEMEYGNEEGNFDIVIVNDDLNDAAKQLENFLNKNSVI